MTWKKALYPLKKHGYTQNSDFYTSFFIFQQFTLIFPDLLGLFISVLNISKAVKSKILSFVSRIFWNSSWNIHQAMVVWDVYLSRKTQCFLYIFSAI